MKRLPYFVAEININSENKSKLIKVFQNNLIIYNHFLDLTEQGIRYDKKTEIKKFIEENSIYPYIMTAILNELYYQEKKLKKGLRREKLISDIQYLTITDNSIEIDFETRKCLIKNTGIQFYINKNLKEEDYVKRRYINLSYSINKDKFEFKLF